MDISATVNYSQTIQQRRVIELYGGNQGLTSNNPKHLDSVDKHGDEAFSFGDVADLGNSRNILASRETVMAMLEEKINARIEAHFKDEPVDKPAPSDEFSPANVAKRIVNFATHFYEAFSKKYGGESEANLTKFLDMVKGAIGEGIGQAEAIIGKPNGGEVPEKNKSVIEQTRDNIDSLLEEFRKSALARLTNSDSTNVESEKPAATLLN